MSTHACPSCRCPNPDGPRLPARDAYRTRIGDARAALAPVRPRQRTETEE